MLVHTSSGSEANLIPSRIRSRCVETPLSRNTCAMSPAGIPDSRMKRATSSASTCGEFRRRALSELELLLVNAQVGSTFDSTVAARLRQVLIDSRIAGSGEARVRSGCGFSYGRNFGCYARNGYGRNWLI